MNTILKPFTDRFTHPLLAGVVVTAVVFFLLALLLDFLAFQPPIVAGFFAVYAVMTGLLGVLGYALLYAVRYASIVRDRMAPHTA